MKYTPEQVRSRTDDLTTARVMLCASRTPMLVLDRDRSVVMVNQSFCDGFDLSEREADGKQVDTLGGGEWNLPALHGLIDRVWRERTEVRDVEMTQPRDTGERHLLVNASLLELSERPLLVLAIEDATPLRRAQTEAQQHADALEQERRRRDEFLAMLGHELRNPLAALSNGLSLLAHTKDRPGQLEKLHPMLMRQTSRMTALLNQLLDLSRVISGRIRIADEAIDLVEVVRAAVEACTPAIDAARHRLELTLPDYDTVYVRGDLIRLTQVVENLLSNAAKYTEDGGILSVALEADDGEARIVVKDTGRGIDPELFPHMFDVFTQGGQTLARSKGGLGLGLPLVRLLVEMHHGHVTASSEVGKGSEFVIHLPRLEPAEAERREAQRIETLLSRVAARRILVVDDEEDAADTLAAILCSRGHDARAVHDGQSALDATRTDLPEIVLLDLGLPDIDGYAVAKRIRAELSDEQQPVIVALTGYQRDTPRLKAAGFDRHMLKPPDLEKLVDVVAEAGQTRSARSA